MDVQVDISGRPTVFEAGLPVLDYANVDSSQAGYRVLRETLQRSPIALGPNGPEVLSYELARTVLRDDRFVSPKGLGLDVQGVTAGPLWDRATKYIVSLDGPEHVRLRRLVAKAFTPRSVERLHDLINGVITSLIDPITARTSCDVVSDIAFGFPTPVICALFGAPQEDWHLFATWADELEKIFGWNIANDGPAIVAAWDELDAYVDAMVARRRESLTDDMLSDLIRAEDDGDRLTHDELLMLAAALLTAGTDTTRHQLSACVAALLEQPDQWARLVERPELARAAVEETMRHSPIVMGIVRRAVVDVELGGVVIPAGTTVIANVAAANRDPAVFDDPDRLDITRESSSAQLTFGGGAHYCLGTHLARAELAAALTAMAGRLPNLHLAGPVQWRPAMVGITGPTSVPIAFDTTVSSPSVLV